MITTLNVKVGSKVTVTLDDGPEADAKITDFPKIVTVQLDSGEVLNVRMDQIKADDAKQPAQRFKSRFQPRL